jgi:hypothetical protein
VPSSVSPLAQSRLSTSTTMPRALPPLEGPTKPPNAVSRLPAPLVESIAGFSAGVISCLTVHPLDLLKNRLQLNTTSKSRPGDSFRILRHVVRDEGGMRALYRGLWPNMLGNSLGWGLYFLFYGRAKEVLQKRKGKGEHLGSAEFFGASIVAGKSPFPDGRWWVRTLLTYCSYRSSYRRLHKSYLGCKDTHARTWRKPSLGLQIHERRSHTRLRHARAERPLGRLHPIHARGRARRGTICYI